MTDLKQAAQQALEALKAHGAHAPNCDHLILLTSLPPQRKPCSCGLVSAITALKQALAEPEPEQKVWCDCGDSIEPDSGAKCGNCVAGDSAEPEQEPVAHLWQHSETGRTRVVMPDQVITADATWFVVGSLYLGTAPTPRKPVVELTDEEIALISGECAASAHRHDDLSFARSIIAAYEKKQGEQT